MLALGAVTDILDWCQCLAREVPSAKGIADELSEMARGADLAAMLQRLEEGIARPS